MAFATAWLAALFLLLVPGSARTQPEQVHLSYGQSPSEMVVVWASRQPCASASSSSTVVFGSSPGSLTEKQSGTCWEFTEGNPDGLHYLHRVVLENLNPGVRYWYAIQTGSQQSTTFNFTAMPPGQTTTKFIVYGDMGRDGGAQSLPSLTVEAMSGKYSAVLHIGDFAYDLHSKGGKTGDDFMNRIEPIAAHVPYMTCPGNHEMAYNFSHYINRFSMPTGPSHSPHWYSWDIGNVHFISYSSEVYFYGWGVEEQYAWLEQDLKLANTPSNRSVRPWIIAYGHRPMYCSNIDFDDCTTSKSKVRAGLESLFYSYGVDVILEAHEHSYERLWPVFNETVTAENYNNPKAPVHFISGTAGCNEDIGECFNPILGPRGPWSAFRSWYPKRHGYARMTVSNATHLLWEQVIADGMRVEDEVWIRQDKHGPFTG